MRMEVFQRAFPKLWCVFFPTDEAVTLPGTSNLSKDEYLSKFYRYVKSSRSFRFCLAFAFPSSFLLFISSLSRSWILTDGFFQLRQTKMGKFASKNDFEIFLNAFWPKVMHGFSTRNEVLFLTIKASTINITSSLNHSASVASVWIQQYWHFASPPKSTRCDTILIFESELLN